MSRSPSLVLVAPMTGWCAPLEEVPDPVFAGRLLGDGVAIDPTEGVLHAPCDGEVITLPAQKHAVTLRASNGAEILLHVGIDTVALNGEGFTQCVAVGARVKTGDRLLTFDLDLLARRATSLLTPVIVTDGAPFSVTRRVTGQLLRPGDMLMELAAGGAAVAAATASAPDDRAAAAVANECVVRVSVPLAHGIHARPAALLANRVKSFAATVTVSARDRSANARSAIALMSLGVRQGEEIAIRAAGPDARTAASALADAIRAMVDEQTEAAHRPVSPTQPARKTTGGAYIVPPTGTLHGVRASPGVATGRAFQLARAVLDVPETGGDAMSEQARLEAARSAVRSTLESSATHAAGAGRDIAAAHLEFLDDPELLAAAGRLISSGKSAGFAWRAALSTSIEALSQLDDARMVERVDDLRDVEYQVLAALDGGSPGSVAALPEGAIVLAHELLPSQFVALDAARLAGICTAAGGPTSHVAVLAAAQDIPMVVAAGPGVMQISSGTSLVLDADKGELSVDPTRETLSKATDAVARRRARRAADEASAALDAHLADGTRVEVFANVGSVAEAEAAVAHGAEGCGLLRTEFLFLDRDTAPDEETQRDQYQRIVSAFAKGKPADDRAPGRPVVIRTLDVGGDKPLAYLPVAREENPALGVRGVRISLQHPDLMRTQLRAILRVTPQGVSRVLLPMIAEPAEIRTVRALLDEIRRDLGLDDPVLLGAMIETPASAVLAASIAREADFLSIGTNDLTQYTLAIDRGNPALAARLDAFHPAVLRLIAEAARAGQSCNRDVAVCGGLASEPAAAPILIGLGVNELSVVPAMVPRLKAHIRTLTLEGCKALAKRALEADGAAEVRRLIAE